MHTGSLSVLLTVLRENRDVSQHTALTVCVLNMTNKNIQEFVSGAFYMWKQGFHMCCKHFPKCSIIKISSLGTKHENLKSINCWMTSRCRDMMCHRGRCQQQWSVDASPPGKLQSGRQTSIMDFGSRRLETWWKHGRIYCNHPSVSGHWFPCFNWKQFPVKQIINGVNHAWNVINAGIKGQSHKRCYWMYRLSCL